MLAISTLPARYVPSTQGSFRCSRVETVCVDVGTCLSWQDELGTSGMATVILVLCLGCTPTALWDRLGKTRVHPGLSRWIERCVRTHHAGLLLSSRVRIQRRLRCYKPSRPPIPIQQSQSSQVYLMDTPIYASSFAPQICLFFYLPCMC
jgi:hypothetical protein